MMRITTTIIAILSATAGLAQFTSVPCTAGPLPISCADNTINLTSSFTGSTVTNPSTENGVGCGSVGSDITAGTVYDYDGWFTTTADAAGTVDVYAAIVSGDPVVGIYSGPCGSPTLLSCDDDGGTGLDANATASGLTPGGTYWVRVWDYAGGTGTYNITSNSGTPPANDDCSGAEGVTVNAAPTGGSNYCSTVEAGDWNDCESNTENNVWYSFTTTADGDIIVNFTSVDCFGSGAGIDVTIFEGNCASFSSYGCNSVAAGSSGSIPSFYGPAGTYYVMVDGNNSGGATSLCEFNIDVDFTGCPANAGTNTAPALIETCANVDFNPTATGTANTNIGTDPCIGWGYWVVSDPLGVFPGMTGLGNLPTGNNPAGSGGDANYAGVFTSIDFPAANGENPTLPAENNGVTYYIAPVTLSNCQTGEITTNCFDIGNVTQVYHNPEIVYATVVDCFSVGLQLTQVSIAVGGGLPSIDGSNFTLTNLGDGILSATTVADGGTVVVTAIPDGGTVSILITDDQGCTETITIAAIDASAYCPACGVDAGNVTTTQTGSGNTTANNGTNGTPFILCFGDNINLTHLNDFVLPPDPNFCGDSPLTGTVAGSCNPGIVYGIFTDFATTANPFDDAVNFSGYGFSGDDQDFLNDGFLIASLIADGIAIVDNTFYLYPVTADLTNIDINGDGDMNWSEDIDGDDCIDSGNPIEITMLNAVTTSTFIACDGPQITITGGSSEFFGGAYSITNNAGGTIIGTPVTHGETITITGLDDGDPYDITITDGNGCSVDALGNYNYTEPTLSINNLASDFCLNDPVDAFDVTPVPFTVTTGSFDIDFVSDGLTDELTWTLEDASGNVLGSGGPYGGYAPNAPLPTETVGGLDPADGPFVLVLNDAFNDGQDAVALGGSIGTTTVTNNITGQTVAFTSGNWGATTTLDLGNFVSTTATITGTSVTDNGDGTASFNPNLEGPQLVTFTYDNGEGCTYTETQVVTVHQVPLLSSTIDPEICAGETILLSDYAPGEANGVAGTGTWYTNAGMTIAASTSAITPTNGQQFYYEYISTAGSCVDDASITVTVNALPSATATNSGPVCVGDALTLTGGANGMTSYGWTGPSSYTDANQSPTISATATAAMAGVYTITVNDGNCTNTATTTVTVNTLPSATAANNGPVCIGDALTLTGGANGMTSYAWSGPSSYTDANQSPTVSATATAAMAGVYTLTVNDGNCTNTATTTVTVNTLPSATAANNGPVCVGDALTLTGGANGMTSYAWSGPSSYSDGNQSPTVSAAATAAMAGVYTITVNDGNCTNTATTTVTINALPAATATNNGPVCVGDALTLTGGANGMTSYGWTGPSSYSDANQSPTVSATATAAMAGVYTLTINDGNCTNTATTTVTVNALPTPTATNNGPVCVGDALTLTGGANGMTSYGWTGPSSYTNANQSPTVSATATAAMAGVYTLTVNDGNCANTATTTVTVNTLPSATAANNGPLCVGDALTLTGGTNGMTSYAWSGPSSYSDGNQSPTVSAAATAAMAGVYTITVNDGNCTNTATTTVTVNALPAATATNNGPVCVGDALTLTGGANGMTSYGWTGPSTYSDANQSPTVSATSTSAMAGVYTLTINDGNCTNTATTTVTVNALPTPTATNNGPVCVGDALTLTGGANGMTSYGWTGPSSYTNANQSPTVSAAATAAMAGVYTLTVNDGNCTNTATTTVTVNPVPIVTIPGDVCVGSTITLTPTTGGTWASSNTSFATVTNAGVVTGVAPGAVSFTFTNTDLCSATTVGIDVNALPAVTAGDVTICADEALNLVGGSAGLTYSWTGPLGFTSTSQSPNVSSNATAAMSGSYTLTGTDLNMCSNSASGTITVNALPTINDGAVSENAPSACGATDGSITGLVGSGTPVLSYSWNAGASQASPDLTGIGASSNTIVITDGNLCTQTYGPYSISDPSAPAAPTITPNGGSACIGGSFTISISSPDPSATYTWSGPGGYTNTGTSITLTNLTAADAGNYDVSTTISGCTTGNAVSPANIVVNALPIVDVLAPLVVNCDNPIVSLDGSNSVQGADITYVWNVSNGGVIIGSGASDTETTSTPGDYELEVNNTTTGCTNTQTVSVTSNNDTPTADIVAPNGGQLDCANPSLTLDGTGSTNDAGGTTGITYTWSTTSGGASIGSGSTLSASAAGDYYLLVEETISGCTDEVMVTISAATGLPVAIVTGNVPLTCTTTSLTLDGSTSTPLSSVDFDWNTSPVTTSLGTGSTVSITTPGDYSLTVTDPLNSCDNTVNFTVTEDITAPTVVVTSPLVVDCNNPIVILDGSGSDQGANLTYAWSNLGTGVILGTADSDTDSTSTADTYTLTVTNTDNGCFATGDILVSMDTLTPVADAGSDVNFPCGVTDVALDGTNSTGTGITYDWTGTGTITDGTTSTPDVSGTGLFTLTITASNGCTSTSTVNVVPDVNAPLADAGTDITIDCNNLTNPLSVALDGSSSDAGMDYLWSTTGTGNITDGTTTTPTVDQAGTYQILVTNTANSCTSTASVTIIMDTVPPIANAGSAAAIDCNSGLVTTLDATSSTGTGLTYVWSSSNGIIDTQTAGSATVSAAGDYDVLVTQTNGCTATSSITIAIDTVTPIIAIVNPGDIDCNGSPLVIDASGTTGSNETYLWSTTETTNSITVSGAGNYSVTVTNDNGCSSTSSVTINSLPAPVAGFTATPTSGQIPLEVDYTNNSTGTALTYSWDFGDGNFDTTQDPINTFNDIGEFTTVLTVTDAAGCTDTASILITVSGTSTIVVPNIFSPNGDDVNDIFNVDGTNITEIRGTIINRWGQTVYEWDVLEIGWDGHTVSGAIASEGTYYYLIDALGADGTVYNLQGPFQLVR